MHVSESIARHWENWVLDENTERWNHDIWCSIELFTK